MTEEEIIKNIVRLQQMAKPSNYLISTAKPVSMTPIVYTILHFLFPIWDAPDIERVWLPENMAVAIEKISKEGPDKKFLLAWIKLNQ